MRRTMRVSGMERQRSLEECRVRVIWVGRAHDKGSGIFVFGSIVGTKGIGTHCKYQPSGRKGQSFRRLIELAY